VVVSEHVNVHDPLRRSRGAPQPGQYSIPGRDPGDPRGGRWTTSIHAALRHRYGGKLGVDRDGEGAARRRSRPGVARTRSAMTGPRCATSSTAAAGTTTASEARESHIVRRTSPTSGRTSRAPRHLASTRSSFEHTVVRPAVRVHRDGPGGRRLAGLAHRRLGHRCHGRRAPPARMATNRVVDRWNRRGQSADRGAAHLPRGAAARRRAAGALAIGGRRASCWSRPWRLKSPVAWSWRPSPSCSSFGYNYTKALSPGPHTGSLGFTDGIGRPRAAGSPCAAASIRRYFVLSGSRSPCGIRRLRSDLTRCPGRRVSNRAPRPALAARALRRRERRLRVGARFCHALTGGGLRAGWGVTLALGPLLLDRLASRWWALLRLRATRLVSPGDPLTPRTSRSSNVNGYIAVDRADRRRRLACVVVAGVIDPECGAPFREMFTRIARRYDRHEHDHDGRPSTTRGRRLAAEAVVGRAAGARAGPWPTGNPAIFRAGPCGAVWCALPRQTVRAQTTGDGEFVRAGCLIASPGKAVENQVILVEEDKNHCSWTTGSACKFPPGAQVIDLGGSTVLPGAYRRTYPRFRIRSRRHKARGPLRSPNPINDTREYRNTPCTCQRTEGFAGGIHHPARFDEPRRRVRRMWTSRKAINRGFFFKVRACKSRPWGLVATGEGILGSPESKPAQKLSDRGTGPWAARQAVPRADSLWRADWIKFHSTGGPTNSNPTASCGSDPNFLRRKKSDAHC